MVCFTEDIHQHSSHYHHSGQAIGDALGSRYEFLPASEAQSKIDSDLVKTGASHHHLPLLGGGPFHMSVGQVTDDTELAMALARTLHKCGIRYDQAKVAERYVHWLRTDPPDVGQTTSNALKVNLKDTTKSVAEQCVNNAKLLNGKSLSNGWERRVKRSKLIFCSALMRQSPLALAFWQKSPGELRSVVELDTQLTHSNPEAAVASLAFVSALVALLKDGSKEVRADCDLRMRA